MGLQDLKDCANTIIGDETAGHKGISGGQRRRVGIGLQLVRSLARPTRSL
jgi:ABC-type multidrug transport system ATPase subunit